MSPGEVMIHSVSVFMQSAFFFNAVHPATLLHITSLATCQTTTVFTPQSPIPLLKCWDQGAELLLLWVIWEFVSRASIALHGCINKPDMLCLWEICGTETMTERHRPCEEHIFWLFWSEAMTQDKA